MNVLPVQSGSKLPSTITVKRSPQKTIKPKKTGSLALFFRKVMSVPPLVQWFEP
jgi:hypothetical protein